MVHQIRKRHEATTEEYLKKIEQSWNGVREKTHKCLEKKKKKKVIYPVQNIFKDNYNVFFILVAFTILDCHT